MHRCSRSQLGRVAHSSPLLADPLQSLKARSIATAGGPGARHGASGTGAPFSHETRAVQLCILACISTDRSRPTGFEGGWHGTVSSRFRSGRRQTFSCLWVARSSSLENLAFRTGNAHLGFNPSKVTLIEWSALYSERSTGATSSSRAMRNRQTL
jgi:hypothetical protein